MRHAARAQARRTRDRTRLRNLSDVWQGMVTYRPCLSGPAGIADPRASRQAGTTGDQKGPREPI